MVLILGIVLAAHCILLLGLIVLNSLCHDCSGVVTACLAVYMCVHVHVRCIYFMIILACMLLDVVEAHATSLNNNGYVGC